LMVEPKSLIRTMIQVNENFYAARQEIMNHHPNFNRTKDSRITVFINCIVTFVLLHEALNVRLQRV
jgi:hypothetical protein